MIDLSPLHDLQIITRYFLFGSLCLEQVRLFKEIPLKRLSQLILKAIHGVVVVLFLVLTLITPGLCSMEQSIQNSVHHEAQ